MTAVYVFAGVVLLLLVGLVAGAFLEREPTDPDDDAPPEERREAAVEALRELEFEYRTGKLDEEDYRQLRRSYARSALEAREEGRAEAGDRREAGDGAALEEARYCPSCGESAGPDARFCGACGERLPATGKGG